MQKIEIDATTVLEVTRKQLVQAYLSECKSRKIEVSGSNKELLESYPLQEDAYLSIENEVVVLHSLNFADPEFSEEPDHWFSNSMMKAGDLEKSLVAASRFSVSFKVELLLREWNGTVTFSF